MRYIFISYANIHFHTDTSEEGRQEIKRMAAYAAGKAGCSACWLDFECRAPQQGELLTSDVNRMCDVIRGAERVVVMLPDQQNKPNPKTMDELLEEWGNRMWTLPEGLLAPGDVHFCQSRGTAEPQITALHKTELSDRAWKDTDVEDPPTRILAECYQGNLDLSRLELFSTALTALGDREPGNLFTDADIAYALMGLLHFRIEPDETDSIFQAIARLSLANDNDRLIERMVCMYPKDTSSFRNLFKTLSHKDQYETRLWDITPLCQVVGGRRAGYCFAQWLQGHSHPLETVPQDALQATSGFQEIRRRNVCSLWRLVDCRRCQSRMDIRSLLIGRGTKRRW